MHGQRNIKFNPESCPSTLDTPSILQKSQNNSGRYMIWTRAAREAAHNNSSGPWQRKGTEKKVRPLYCSWFVSAINERPGQWNSKYSKQYICTIVKCVLHCSMCQHSSPLLPFNNRTLHCHKVVCKHSTTDVGAAAWAVSVVVLLTTFCKQEWGER